MLEVNLIWTAVANEQESNSEESSERQRDLQ